MTAEARLLQVGKGQACLFWTVDGDLGFYV